MSTARAMPKEVRLVQFLEALASIRSKTVRDVSSYEHVLWLGRVPDEPECFSRHREGAPDDDADLWFEVRQPEEPVLPAPPGQCLSWIGDWDRNNFEIEPELRETILAPRPAPPFMDDAEEGDEIQEADEREEEAEADEPASKPLFLVADEELHLRDHPEIREQWDAYIESKWKPWTAERSRWQGVQAQYAKLFDIHSYMQTRGEQVELVLANGLLTWRVDDATIRRHLVVARVDLSFDEKRGRFSVRPHSAGALLHPEFDMLPPEVRPPSLETTAEQEIRTADDDIWDRVTIDQVLESIAHRLSDQGVFCADIRTTDRAPTDKPVIDFAPALILRRRSGRSVHQFLKTIREQVAAGGEVPAGWGDLTERGQIGDTSTESDGPSSGSASTAETEYYFPLLANDEQRSILKALDHPIGALVQGPPGTGKSHTIANLICHLLATGKRILITAQTPRALQVLKDKLPPNIRPLAVSLLGASADEKRSLEESVGGITGRFGGKQPDQYRAETRELASKRADVQKRAASLLQQRRSIRERDIMVQSVCGYSGTAEEIAKVLAAEEDGLSWFTDEVPYDDEHEVGTEPLGFAVKTLKRLHSANRIRIKKRRPIIGTDILSSTEFTASVESERASKADTASLGSDDCETASIDAAELQPMLRDVVTVLQTLDVAISNASARPQKWLQSALQEVLTKQDRPWFELHSATEELLSAVRDIAREEDRRTLHRPEDLDWAQICADAKTLRQHLAQGHKLRLWIVKPRAIKACRYLTTEVRIDGSPCSTADMLDALIRHAHLHLELGHIWKLWDGKAMPSSQSLAIQTNEIEELQEALDEVLGAYLCVDEAVEKIAAVPGLAEPEWASAISRGETLSSLQRRVALMEYASAKGKINRLKDALSTYGASASADVQSVNRLLAAVEARDTVQYATVCESMSQLDEDAADLVAAQVTLSGLSKWLPQLASSLSEDPTNADWNDRLTSLSSAINHARALGWLRDYLDDANLDEIEDGVSRCEEGRRELLTKEAANLAWAYTFDRMEETHRRALKAWQQAMKALGKGTGRHAPRHRREAQLQLRKSLPAIPAWIMPLHRVFDSIDPFPGMFDVIIVDEASQCGPDALPLFYIGKKVLIVGDDKQISPSHVGTSRDHVHQRIREYLDDFEHKGSFDLERSLFDHGDLRMRRPIVLREHFRCMPEIIRFSNDLCYSVNPLIPLRQYPPDRLEPLVSHHVRDGYREGDSSNAINKPEAEQLVEAVVKCCRDPRYTRDDEKLTFGIISLQGFKQAEFIEHLLLEAIGAEEMAERRLVCGDAYSFQGDERDVVFLSMVAAPNSPLRALTRFLYYQRYNVAASRAKDQLWLFHSVLPKDLSDQCLRRKLLEHFLDPSRSARTIADLDVDELRLLALRANRTVDNQPPPFDSWFEIDVALRIAAKGFRVVPQVESGGYWIDLVVEGLKSRLAVECDGDHWHGPEAYESDLVRETKLKRAGWTFVRVRSCSFYANPDAAMQPVWDRVEELGIKSLREAPLEPSGLSDSVDLSREARQNEDVPLGNEAGSTVERNDSSRVLRDDAPQEIMSDEALDAVSVAPVDVEPKVSDHSGVEPYEEWVPAAMPDPREEPTRVVMEGLLSIVEAEGPVLASRAYHLYANAAGLQRVGKTLQGVFNKAAWKAKREGRLELEQADDDKEPMLNAILRPSGSPPIRPRTAGGRSMAEIPTSEIMWFMQSYIEEQPTIQDEDLYRNILDHYGLKRLRGPTRDRLIEIHLSLLDADMDNES